MAQFDMRSQRVTHQYNAGRDVNVGTIQTSAGLIAEIEKLEAQLAQARDAHQVREETATDAQSHLTRAKKLARKPDPDKKTLVDHLTTAKTLLETTTAASGLVAALVGVLQIIQKLF